MDLFCFLSDYFNNYHCGNFRGKSACVNILECLDDVSTQLSRCNLSREKLCEYDPILLRCGMFDISHHQLQHMKICPNHRCNFGKFWRPSRVCQYSPHTGSNSADGESCNNTRAYQRCTFTLWENSTYWIL